MKRTVLCSIVTCAALLAAVSAWAEDPLAVMKEVKGRVELKVPGDVWRLAAAGATLEKETVVSTGFNSQAVVALGESVLTIKPLTRLTLEDIARQEGSETVRLYLLAGRVRAKVSPPIGGQTDFKVKSPTATASVRGTDFDFDSVNLDVSDGVVSLSGTSGGPSVQVAQGESSHVDETGSASVPVSIQALTVAPPPAPVGIDTTFFTVAQPVITVVEAPTPVQPVVPVEPTTPAPTTGTVGITVGW